MAVCEGEHILNNTKPTRPFVVVVIVVVVIVVMPMIACISVLMSMHMSMRMLLGLREWLWATQRVGVQARVLLIR